MLDAHDPARCRGRPDKEDRRGREAEGKRFDSLNNINLVPRENAHAWFGWNTSALRH
ncbi:hypothetical protein EDB86DRAFT_3079633 [Lactarius hatsudake]|nr:hypothetical protein EDB86DRAFT_3079633 [Lactarius hatsudake]